MAFSTAAVAVVGAGMSAYGSYEKGKAGAAADQYQAQKLERAAEVGRVKAVQTSAQLTERENDMLGNIDAVRAAAHDDPTSPTGAAIRQTAEDRATRQKTITVDNILEQSTQDVSDAAFEREAAKWALLGGEIDAGSSLFKGVGSALSSYQKG